jgi:antitoxin (DNA-binding transcriptional repressor) of toxin-antitoxin stability system
MRKIDINNAATSLSIERGQAVICRDGSPIAKLVAIEKHQRIGIAKDLYEIPDSIDATNDHVLALFKGEAKAR